MNPLHETGNIKDTTGFMSMLTLSYKRDVKLKMPQNDEKEQDKANPQYKVTMLRC